MRHKAEVLIGKLDRNGDGALSVSEEIVPNLNFFSDHELTQSGDMLYFRDEL